MWSAGHEGSHGRARKPARDPSRGSKPLRPVANRLFFAVVQSCSCLPLIVPGMTLTGVAEALCQLQHCVPGVEVSSRPLFPNFPKEQVSCAVCPADDNGLNRIATTVGKAYNNTLIGECHPNDCLPAFIYIFRAEFLCRAYHSHKTKQKTCALHVIFRRQQLCLVLCCHHI